MVLAVSILKSIYKKIGKTIEHLKISVVDDGSCVKYNIS